MSPPPDVTAVVLTLGEPTTARAIESVSRQTLTLSETVVVDRVSPFHRALNEGAARVRTPLFVQVDADMVLDPDCVERLAACLAGSVGVVVGQLRDPLYGRVGAIKLFRTECVERHPFRDSISPDTDFIEEIGRHGWAAMYALRPQGRGRAQWHTFGEHDPGYTALYTYAKHTVDGRRLRYRQDAAAVRYHQKVLHESMHPASLIAEVALGHGLCLDGDGDLLAPYREDRDFHGLMRLVGRAGHEQDEVVVAPPLRALSAKAAFRRYYRFGIALARTESADGFRGVLDCLHESQHPWAWVARVALCHGIFVEWYDRAVFEGEWSRLAGFRTSFKPALLARYFGRRLLMRGAALARVARGTAVESHGQR